MVCRFFFSVWKEVGESCASTAGFRTIGPDVFCLVMPCLALSDELAQKKDPANDLPWKHPRGRDAFFERFR